MRIATWNVNSIRARIHRVVDWLHRSETDILAIQETKCKDTQFPEQPLLDAGYQLAHIGLNQWNGVAIASRVGLEDVQFSFPGQPGFTKDPTGDPVVEARAISALCNGIRIWSLYIPNGRELDDPHYTYKLIWLEQLRQNIVAWQAAQPEQPLALVGDWNVAPTDHDVWDPNFFIGKTHTSLPERAAFQGVLDAGLSDVVRPYVPAGYTYWDYTQLRFPRNEGMRIDFVLGSPSFASRVTTASIDRNERKGKGASDHVPVIVDLA